MAPPKSTRPIDGDGPAAADSSIDSPNEQYLVIARRYRPQGFAELIGQEHVARALTNAITANRVGHAYLFTGARGVGKTSAARILAKALNCETGPSPNPCNVCDICQSISSGGDVDVLEIDGASNRGIDEIRQLRQNVNIRPSRARFKIYIIDEVHMLTREAFNALLKTLEEPPEHVKFIFCTTEPTKIPITILSRCQRFDFAGIRAGSIAERLAQIVAAEGVTAEPAALEILARRASGSMRDSQSLLEQLLSFGEREITTADVHSLLGTAGETRLLQLGGHLVERDAAGALADLDAALTEGVDVGQLLEQLLGYFRDCMAAAVGCSAESFLHVSAAEQAQVVQAVKQLGLETILAILQIIDQTLTRLRHSTQTRMLAELALVRICALENLDDVSQLIAQFRQGGVNGGSLPPATAAASSASPAAAKKKADLTTNGTSPAPSAVPRQSVSPPHFAQPLAEDDLRVAWQQALQIVSGLLAEMAAFSERVAIPAPNRLVVAFRAKYNSCKSFCERPDQTARLEEALATAAGRLVKIEWTLLEEDATAEPATRKPVSQRQRIAEKAEHPLIRRAVELFDAELLRVDEPDGP